MMAKQISEIFEKARAGFKDKRCAASMCARSALVTGPFASMIPDRTVRWMR
jgi:hypothetical protein